VSAPAVVLLHGFTHTGASWEPVTRALGERYTAIAPDIRGHGAAANAVPVTLEAVVNDVAAAAPPEGTFTLVGYSMGGRIALHVALAEALREAPSEAVGEARSEAVGEARSQSLGKASSQSLGEAPSQSLGKALSEAVGEARSARVDRLVLIGASPGIADDGERADRRAADERLAEEMQRSPDIDALARRWAETPLLAGQPARVRESVHADRLRNTPGGLARALRGLGAGALPPVWDGLTALAMPVALVVGERDTKFRGIASQMAARIPHSELVVVPGCGHAVHLEAPAAVAAVIRGSRRGVLGRRTRH
jgi:2-succinyl-6-hydroxy-2,4-cyclohexadiene-1-carboxylate synthase